MLNYLKPIALTIGVTAGTLWILHRILPGIGGGVGLFTNPLFPRAPWPLRESKSGSLVPSGGDFRPLDAINEMTR